MSFILCHSPEIKFKYFVINKCKLLSVFFFYILFNNWRDRRLYNYMYKIYAFILLYSLSFLIYIYINLKSASFTKYDIKYFIIYLYLILKYNWLGALYHVYVIICIISCGNICNNCCYQFGKCKIKKKYYFIFLC